MFHDMSMIPRSQRDGIANQPRRAAELGRSPGGRRPITPHRVERHDLDACQPLSITVKPEALVIARYIGTDGRMRAASGNMHAKDRQPVVFARPGPIVFETPAAGQLQIDAIPRNRLQAVVSAWYGGARRIVPRDPRFLLSAAINDALDRIFAGRSVNDMQPAIEAALIAALAEDSDPAVVFPQVRSISAAMELVTRYPERSWTTPDLASAAAVTAPVLRRGFRASLGLTVGQYVLSSRLTWLRNRLLGGRETRSVAALAAELGFHSPSAFARAYARQFGESPSRTRADAVAKMQ